MGMYCEVMFREVKMSGLIARSVVNLASERPEEFPGVELVYDSPYSLGRPLLGGGLVGLSFNNVQQVVRRMERTFGSGVTMMTLQDVYSFQKDVGDYVALVEWLQHSKDEADGLWFG